MFHFLKDLAWNSGKEFFKNGCPQLAAAITYYAVFSIFPFMILCVTIAGALLDQEAQDNIVDEILKWLPFTEDEGREDLEDALDALSGSTAQAVGLVGLGLLLWSASSMFNSVRRALNIVFGDPTYTRPFVPQKLIDLAFVLGLGLFFAASAFTSTLLTLLRNRSDDVKWPAEVSGSLLWMGIEWIVAALLAFIAFTVLYLVAPSRPRRLVDVWPGALVAAILFQVAVSGFGWYVSSFTDYSVIYGSLSAIIAFLFWLFISAEIMLIGAEIASVYPRVRAGEFRQEGMGGMGVPLHQQAINAAIGLFVRRPPPG